MPFIKAGRLAEDRFVRVADDEPVPDEAAVIISAERLLADDRELANRNALTGVIWPNDRSVAALVPYLDRLALIALIFPTYRDGRAYSQARILRERHGFRGELRATGDVLRDQFLFLARSGFDAFEVKKAADAAALTDAMARFNVCYQPAGDERASVFMRRLSAPGRHGSKAVQETTP